MADSIVSGPFVGLVVREGPPVTLLTARDAVRLSSDAPIRHAMSREQAQRVVDSLCRDGEGAELPVEVQSREALFEEIAMVLAVPERALRAAIKRKDPTLEPPEAPRIFAEHEYLGAFRSEGQLIIADRCYVDRTQQLLVIRTPVLPGEWHAYVRTDPNFRSRTIGLLVVHGDHILAAKDAGQELGIFGVDAGCAVVVDARVLSDSSLVLALTGSPEWEEGLIRDVGCFAYTYDGDGMYRARAIERDGAVVAVRVNLSRDERYDYHDPPPHPHYTERLERDIAEASKVPVKVYSPSETFAVGDRVSHKKFGEGLVRAIIDAGKVEIAFADGVKTLVQGKR